MKKLLCILLLLLAGFVVFPQELSVIPQPVKMERKAGSFSLTKKTCIVVTDDGDKSAADFLNRYLKQCYGLTLPVTAKAEKNAISLSTKKFIQAPDKDGYSFSSGNAGVVISGDTYAGTFYGVQTLLQLLPADKAASGQYTVPAVDIEDAPRFKYRGLHLDCGRHFFSIDFIKKYIDYIALHKMNYFHWHLTEDQGWRIEIKKYPKLTTVGAWRNGTIIGHYPGTGSDNKEYGGYYTQDQVREIVRYAAERHITVVPEIEMPGHGSAAIAAYPFLSCFPDEPTVIKPNMISDKSVQEQKNGRVKLVQETWGVFDDVFCAGKDSTFRFLQDVIDEVVALFPSPYIHVGGDECPKANWKRCPNCQKRMKDLGLKDEHELQSYFIQRMEKYINSKGKTLIGWDEILEGGLAPNAVVMSWRGEKGGIEAAKQKHTVIMTPTTYVYLDYAQKKNEDSLTIGGFIDLEKIYKYEPYSSELTPEEAKYIMGGQANVWTEYMAYPGKVEYMIFPRLTALSEVLWSPAGSKNWEGFQQRMSKQYKRYGLWQAHFCDAFMKK